MNMKRLVVGLGLALGVVSSARADSISMTTANPLPPDILSINWQGSWESAYTGAINWQVVSSSGNSYAYPAPGTSVSTFCIDLPDVVYVPGYTYSYVVTPGLVGVPIPGTNSQISSTQAGLMYSLYDSYFSSLTGADDQAAFQLALWDILYGSVSGGKPLSLYNSANSFQTAQSTPANLANGWLQTLSSTASPSPGMVALVSDDHAQNQAAVFALAGPPVGNQTTTVPVPTALWGGLALMIVLAARRYGDSHAT